MGDVIREETRHRALEITPENAGKVMLDLRQKEGPAAIAKRCLPKIAATHNPRILIDGLRSLDEANEFQKQFKNFTLIAVHSSPMERYERLHRRGRPDDAKNYQTFQERDTRELSVGLGNVIAMAEEMILNEGPMDMTKQKIRQTLERVERKWKK